MIRYFENDIDGIWEFQKFLDSVGLKVTEQEVWEEARKEEGVPFFEDVYWRLVFTRLKDYISEKLPEVEVNFEVMGRSSVFTIDGEKVYDYFEIKDAVRCSRLTKELKAVKDLRINKKFPIEVQKVWVANDDTYYVNFFYKGETETQCLDYNEYMSEFAEQGVEFFND